MEAVWPVGLDSDAWRRRTRTPRRTPMSDPVRAEHPGRDQPSLAEPSASRRARDPGGPAPMLSAATSALSHGVLQRKLAARMARREATATGAPSAVQARRDGASSSDPTPEVHEAAEAGTRGAGGTLPFLGEIQRSFGRHDV